MSLTPAVRKARASLRKLLKLDGMSDRQASSLIVSLEHAHKKGWTGLHTAYCDSIGTSHTARASARQRANAEAEKTINATITATIIAIATFLAMATK